MDGRDTAENACKWGKGHGSEKTCYMWYNENLDRGYITCVNRNTAMDVMHALIAERMEAEPYEVTLLCHERAPKNGETVGEYAGDPQSDLLRATLRITERGTLVDTIYFWWSIMGSKVDHALRMDKNTPMSGVAEIIAERADTTADRLTLSFDGRTPYDEMTLGEFLEWNAKGAVIDVEIEEQGED
jgi:hypothetical protein